MSRRPAVAIMALALTAAFVPARFVAMSLLDAVPVLFRDVAVESGVTFTHINGASPAKHIVETMGSGGVLFDYDGDGWLDILLVDGGSVADAGVAARAGTRLLRNQGNGTFDDVTRTAKIEHRAFGMGACAADYDNDGHEDLYLTNFGPNVLLHNNGDGTFADVTKTAGVGATSLSTSCAFADIDNDGRLDLFVANYVDPEDNSKVCGDSQVRAYCRPDVYKGAPNVLYRNNGNGTFVDVTRAAGVYRSDGKGLGVVFADYDDDGRDRSSWRTTWCRTSCFTTKGAERFGRSVWPPAWPWRVMAGPGPAWARTGATTTGMAVSIWSSPISKWKPTIFIGIWATGCLRMRR